MNSQSRPRLTVFSLVACTAIGCTAAASPHGAVGPSRDATLGDERAVAIELARRGSEQARLGDTLRAEEYFASALEAGGVVDEILPKLMRASIAGRRYQSAISYFEDYQPQLSHARRAQLGVIVGVLYLGVEQPERARAALEAALVVDSKNARAHFLLAQSLRDDAGDYGAAEIHFRAYLTLEPNGESALLARAGLLTPAATSTEKPSARLLTRPRIAQ